MSINADACLSGKVRLGNGLHIASHVSIVGLNHGFDDLETASYRQPLATLAIHIHNDVWIGVNAVVLDGVTIGKGAVVAKDVHLILQQAFLPVLYGCAQKWHRHPQHTASVRCD